MSRGTPVPKPVVFPVWDPDVDGGVTGLTRHGEAVMAYISEFGLKDGSVYAASKPATIVSFEPYQKTDYLSSEEYNVIRVRFVDNVLEVVSVKAKYVWPRKAVASTSRHGGGVGGSAGGAAGAAEKSGLAALQLQYKTAQAHIKALATENQNLATQNKQLGDSVQFLLQRNTEINQQLELEKAMKMNCVQRCMVLETAAKDAQNQQQNAQDKLEIARDELATTKNKLRGIQDDLDTLHKKNTKKTKGSDGN